MPWCDDLVFLVKHVFLAHHFEVMILYTGMYKCVSRIDLGTWTNNFTRLSFVIYVLFIFIVA